MYLLMQYKCYLFYDSAFLSFSLGLPTIYHIFAHVIPVEERSRAFGYLVAMGSIGQTVSAVVSAYIQLIHQYI